MWKETKSRMFVALLITSVVVHVAFVAAVPTADATTTPAPAPTLITITDSPPPPPPPPPPPVTAEPETPSPRATRIAPRATQPIARRRPAAPPQQVAAPSSPEPVDLSGVTLSNDGGSWSSPTGNGEVAQEPVVAPTAAPRQPTGRTAGPRVVAVGDLSRPPKAPDLDAALAANYPAEARRAGRTGKAVVRARIQPDGSVGMIRIVSETDPGFGMACKLTGSRWQAPLDAHRTAVATDINYTCTFSVAR